MIDDDFDKIVRNMFEQFFGNSFRISPAESRHSIRFDSNAPATPSTTKEEDAFVDMIDFEREIMIIIETAEHIENPVAKVSEDMLRLKVNPGSLRVIEIKIPSPVDLQTSTLSYNNGVIEITLAKTDGPQKEGTLNATFK